ncbi:MAG: hypothetical protein PHW74_06590 [Desulfobacca sp.]|nr:hypothetical protein [Desulfobacca sp.]
MAKPMPDHTHANLADLESNDQNFGESDSPAFAGLTGTGNISLTGTLDGVDIGAQVADISIQKYPANKSFLDSIDQNLGTTATPTFAGLNVNGDITTGGQVDGVEVSAHAARHAVGGEDVLTGDLDANARVLVKIDGQTIGARRAVNLVAGENITLSAVDNPSAEEIAITLAAGSDQSTPETLQVEDLGPVISSATIDDKFLFNEPQTGNTHLMLYYYVREIGKYPFQLLDINLNTGDTRIRDAVFGRPGPNGTVLHSSGKIYTGSSDPGYLMVYDPVTGTVQQLGKLADKGAQYMIEGDDGAIYIGECVKGFVERYDPQSGVLENFGIMDDPGAPYYRYAYTIGADNRYVYVAIRDGGLWYLVVYDREEKTQTVHWKELSPTSVNVYPGMDNLWYAQMNSASTGKKWYLLNGKVAVESPAPQVNHDRMPITIQSWDYAANWAKFPYEVDLTNSVPYNDGQVNIKWRLKEGPGPWQQTTATLRVQPYEFKRLYAKGKQFFGFTPSYGPVFHYNPDTRLTEVLGHTMRSIYAALSFDTQRWYFVGYPAATMEYDPTVPWTLNQNTTALYAPEVNPHLIRLGQQGKYHYYLAAGADGCIYVGQHWERDGVGGSLGWYNPVTKETGGWREPFLQHDVRDLVASADKQKIVYSSKATEAGIDGKLFVFDILTKQLESFTPLPGEWNAGKLAAIGANQILGFVENSTTGDKFYKADLGTKEIIFVKPLGGKIFNDIKPYDQRLVIGPDGFVWLYIDNFISRINPSDGNIEKIIEAPPAGGLVFYKNDLYIYGSYTLRRIENIISYLNNFSLGN